MHELFCSFFMESEQEVHSLAEGPVQVEQSGWQASTENSAL